MIFAYIQQYHDDWSSEKFVPIEKKESATIAVRVNDVVSRCTRVTFTLS